MIRKIEMPEMDETYKSAMFAKILGNKINELVDAVNNIQKEREAERFEIQEWIGLFEEVRKSVNVHKKQIGDLQNRITALDDPTYHEEPAENATNSKMEQVAENGQGAKIAQGFKNLQELARKAEKECRFNPVQADREVYKALTRSENVQSGTESRSENVQELALVRKELEIAVDALKYANKCIKGGCVNWETEIDKALEQITALEQKD